MISSTKPIHNQRKNIQKNVFLERFTKYSVFIFGAFFLSSYAAISTESNSLEQPNTQRCAQTKQAIIKDEKENYQTGISVSKLHSEQTKKDYKLLIKLPKGYEHSSKTYPVIYVLDAQAHLQHVISANGNYVYDGIAPEAIIVGVTWQTGGKEMQKLRTHDFTTLSNNKSMGPTGGAAQFLLFLQNELIPHIESQFKTNDKRTLTGSSFSGLFALYSLFNQPELFDNIISISAPTSWGGGIFKTYQQAFIAKKLIKPIKLFIARGEFEAPYSKANDQTAKQLLALNKVNFSVANEIVLNAGHSGVNAQAYARGLAFFYVEEGVEVPIKTLKAYTGTYKITGDGTKTPPFNKAYFSLVEGQLIYKGASGYAFKLAAENSRNFFIQGYPVTFAFSEQAGMTPQTLTIESSGKKYVLTKSLP